MNLRLPSAEKWRLKYELFQLGILPFVIKRRMLRLNNLSCCLKIVVQPNLWLQSNVKSKFSAYGLVVLIIFVG